MKNQKINIEATIRNILNAQRLGTSVNETNLRKKIDSLEDPTELLLECARLVRCEVVYLDEEKQVRPNKNPYLISPPETLSVN